jgi:hypothetical protein
MSRHPVDLCQTSIDILGKRCRDWFSARSISGPVWFADDTAAFPTAVSGPTSEAPPVNVVLFGGFLRRFLQSETWNAPNVRLWVISEASRRVLGEMMEIEPSHIGLIPRYELFPQGPDPRPFPPWSRPLTLVFAGRISPVKNIEALLGTVWHLQTEHKLPVTLRLIGEFDNQPHPEAGRGKTGEYRAKIEELIEKLPWHQRPRLEPKSAPDEWYKKDFENPVLTNFSTFLCEDFDVSLAQAQSLGWPALITAWGGHLDAVGEGLQWLPPQFVGRSYESEESIMRKSQDLARHALTRPSAIPPRAGGRLSLTPMAMTAEQLSGKRRRLIQTIGPEAYLLSVRGLHSFAETEAGRQVLRRYAQSFAERPTWNR